jgi:hypothetical protein
MRLWRILREVFGLHEGLIIHVSSAIGIRTNRHRHAVHGKTRMWSGAAGRYRTVRRECLDRMMVFGEARKLTASTIGTP